jgi:6-phosphogluconolactonase (cycloisomerase 2 family)
MHRDRLYVLSELTAEVFFCEKGASGWEIRQAVSAVPGLSADPALMVPQTADVLSIGAAIKLSEDGRYILATCRLGYQTVSAFRLGEDGGLHFCDAVRTGGITPRDIEVVGDTVIAAHQDSDLVTAVPFDRASERFGGVASSLVLPSPTCVVSV